mmetsp:Transcript_29289/g.77403  ORF Transcript_29289/g.77403 Transcript_29289/m.77403 type:complete len:231 (+) Transcript_29289:2289-2981(+)
MAASSWTDIGTYAQRAAGAGSCISRSASPVKVLWMPSNCACSRRTQSPPGVRFSTKVPESQDERESPMLLSQSEGFRAASGMEMSGSSCQSMSKAYASSLCEAERAHSPESNFGVQAVLPNLVRVGLPGEILCVLAWSVLPRASREQLLSVSSGTGTETRSNRTLKGRCGGEAGAASPSRHPVPILDVAGHSNGGDGEAMARSAQEGEALLAREPGWRGHISATPATRRV